MGTAMSAQSFGGTPMLCSEGAEVRWKITLEIGPTLRKIRVLIAMWTIRNVVALADVNGSDICPAIRGVVT